MAKAAKSEARKVILIDGHSLAFRAFFALPDTLVTSSGQITNAVYGFTAMLIKLLADERPDAVVVCFDKGAPQFRLDRYAEYKAGRAETPDTFRQQLPLIREVLKSLRIPMVELEGYEADDLLATLTKHLRQEGNEVLIVTGDRDILQLVGGAPGNLRCHPLRQRYGGGALRRYAGAMDGFRGAQRRELGQFARCSGCRR